MATYPIVNADGTHAIGGTWYGEPGEYYAHGSLEHLIGDENDGTYAYGLSYGAYAEMRVGNIALGASQRCAQLRAGIRCRAGTDPPYDTVNFDMWLKPWHSGDRSGVEFRGALSRTFTDYWGAWHGGEFYQNTLNDMMVGIRENYTAYTTDVSKVMIQADIRTRPTAVLSTPSPGSTGHPLRPTVTWTRNLQGDTYRGFRVYITNSSTGVTVYDSGHRTEDWTSFQIPTDLVAGTSYAAWVQVATDFLGQVWWSNTAGGHIFTIEGPPTSTVTAPVGVLTTTNTPTVVFTYTGVSAKNAHRLKIFSQADIDSPGFNPDTAPAWYDSFDVGGAGLSQTTNVPLLGGIQFRVYLKVRNSNNTWQTNWTVGPQFSILAAGVDKPQRVLFALSGQPGPQNGGGYIEFDDTKRAGSFSWRSAPVRSPDGRQVEIREIQVYVKTYDPNATISVTVGATTRVVTIPSPSRQQIPFLFKERGETLDVRIVSSAGDPATKEAPSLEVVRIGWKPLHQLRKP